MTREDFNFILNIKRNGEFQFLLNGENQDFDECLSNKEYKKNHEQNNWNWIEELLTLISKKFNVETFNFTVYGINVENQQVLQEVLKKIKTEKVKIDIICFNEDKSFIKDIKKRLCEIDNTNKNIIEIKTDSDECIGNVIDIIDKLEGEEKDTIKNLLDKTNIQYTQNRLDEHNYVIEEVNEYFRKQSIIIDSNERTEKDKLVLIEKEKEKELKKIDEYVKKIFPTFIPKQINKDDKNLKEVDVSIKSSIKKVYDDYNPSSENIYSDVICESFKSEEKNKIEKEKFSNNLIDYIKRLFNSAYSDLLKKIYEKFDEKRKSNDKDNKSLCDELEREFIKLNNLKKIKRDINNYNENFLNKSEI